ncbi:glycine zipper 2TM domain-containing protein [Ideonella sp. BN130291]|uniref:glycine zipper 2TM domain-containing protein n=1 Tax=Ideonella sp. BN130291 TaxID=3112940 RepID=UPI002E277459|nr:glycine zipper 2TM domain-containing protein [Ideonella sp. BN130291]
MTRTLTLVAAASALAMTVGCSSPQDPGARPVAPVTQSPSAYQGTQYGQVRAINVVDRPGTASGAGAVLGAVVGGALGTQVGKGDGRTAATVGGAVAGGVIGNEIEKRRTSGTEVYRVEVQFDDGRTATYDFKELNGLQIGDRVRWQDNQLYRM